MVLDHTQVSSNGLATRGEVGIQIRLHVRVAQAGRIIVINRKVTLPFIPNGDGTYFHAIDVNQWRKMDDLFLIDANWGCPPSSSEYWEI